MTGTHWPEAHDRLVLALGATRPTNDACARLGARLGRSGTAVLIRWRALRDRQLAPRGGKGNDWSAAEIALLEDTAGWRSPEAIAAQLGRTPTAVRLKAKKLGVRWTRQGKEALPGHGLTARAVARALGVQDKAVTWWLDRGYLAGTRRAVGMGPHKMWRVQPAAIEAFLRDYRWLYDPARIVDRGWRAFVAALPVAAYVGTIEAARLLCYQPGSIPALIRRGDLAGEKWGANWRIPLRAIHAFVPPPIAYGHDQRVRDEVTTKRATVLGQRLTGRKEEAA